MNIVDVIREETQPFRDRTAIVEGDRSITYAQLLEYVETHSAGFVRLGIGPGQRIAFRCKDGIDCVVGSLSLLATGAVLVPVADSLTETETHDMLERIDVHGMIIHRDLARSEQGTPHDTASDPLGGSSKAEGRKSNANLQPSTSNLQPSIFNLQPPTYVWQPRRATGELDQACRDLDAAFIRFSSGTTGLSKGVVLSHRAILERTDAADRGLKMSHRDVVLWTLEMSHHFVVSILLFLRRAATIVVANEPFPFSLFDAAVGSAVTFIYASPLHYYLLASADAVPASALSRVRLAISTAMKMPPEISETFAGKFGFAPAEAYGIIEIGLPFINRDASPDGAGTVGKILPDYQVRIHGPDDSSVGEVHIRGKGMFDAYFSPWCLRDHCLRDGWFSTGDLGRLDEQGRLQLVSRCKTVIVCGGMKVFPEEVEEVINSLPGVAESLVFGQEHPQFCQVPAARVVLAEAADDREQWSMEIRRYCCEKLSPYKVPVEIQLVDSLPKTPSGKLLRRGSLEG